MIYAELAGGLGNQMFIYAFARALGLRCGEPVTLLDRQDWRDGAPAHTVCALDALNISPVPTSSSFQCGSCAAIAAKTSIRKSGFFWWFSRPTNPASRSVSVMPQAARVAARAAASG